MRRFLLILALVLVPDVVFGQSDTRWCPLGVNGTTLSNVALNGAAASRTFKFGPVACRNEKVASFRWLVLEMEFTHTTSGNVLVTCTTGQTLATADKTPQTCSGSGTCTANDAGIVSKAVTGSKKWAARLGIRGYRAWSCVASHDSTPVAGDKLTVGAYLTD